MSQLRRWGRGGLVALGLVAGGIVMHGADRRPASAASGQVSVALPEITPARLRVASFNLHRGVGRDRVYDLQRAADTLVGFDLIGLNEVAGGWLGHDPSQAATLGQRLGMGAVFAPTEQRWWHDHFGNGVLTRLPVQRWESVPLVGTRGRAFRNYTTCEIPWQGVTLCMMVTHIDREADRGPQLDAVFQAFNELRAPAVLMGDFNTRRDDPRIERFLARDDVTDTLAGADEDVMRRHIDWIFTKGLRTIETGTRDLGASDHPCVWAELELIRDTNKARVAQATP